MIRKRNLNFPSNVYARLYKLFYWQIDSYNREMFYKELNSTTNIFQIKFAVFEDIRERK